MKRLVLAVGVVLSSAAISRADSPPPAYVDNGACPFECCVYRTWITKIDTVLYARPDRTARVVGHLKAGTTVDAVTGEVHSSPARFVVKKPHASYKPGDVLSVYTYLGEGHFKVWRNGAMQEEDLGFSPFGGSAGTRCENEDRCWGQLEKELQLVWWVKLKSEDGREGWSDQPEHFGDKDACG